VLPHDKGAVSGLYKPCAGIAGLVWPSVTIDEGDAFDGTGAAIALRDADDRAPSGADALNDDATLLSGEIAVMRALIVIDGLVVYVYVIETINLNKKLLAHASHGAPAKWGVLRAARFR
jgi:hypothetical protein